MTTLADTERAVGKALRDLAKGTGMRVFQRSLIWQEDDIVAEVRLHGLSETFFFAKPVDWDIWLWDILQITDRMGRTVTRHWKRFTTPVPILERRNVRARDPEALAAAIRDHAQLWQGMLPDRVPRDFPAMFAARCADERAWHFVLTEVIWHISDGRFEAAREICEAVLSGTRDSRFSLHATDYLETDAEGRHPHLTFFELALRHLERSGRIAPRPRPVI